MLWTQSFQAPAVIDTEVLTRLPDQWLGPASNPWGRANMPGAEVKTFLEGPVFDTEGNLYIVDIPNGRIFRITPAHTWEVVAETGGWPNGLAVDRDGQLWVADYQLGLLRVDPITGGVETVLGHRNSERFKGLNDLTFDSAGNLYFTDQGQTGLHDPSGRVYRLRPGGQLDLILNNVPSPNGIVLDSSERFLYVAVTRANAVWRMPLLADGSVAKVGAFQTFFGTSGPDGLAMTADGRLLVAHASLGAFVLSPQGWVTHYLRGTPGHGMTNIALRPGSDSIVLTESLTGTIRRANVAESAVR